NIIGAFSMLEAARAYWLELPTGKRQGFRFLHVSTDEVYGSLGKGDAPFTETHLYEPNSPYSASSRSSSGRSPMSPCTNTCRGSPRSAARLPRLPA
ncbi:MAG: GDP-mannose 4,6-dehydratase, partial [Burkholderiales bacterium]|nr:GDP-mannose 4,6-dehydratase [Burkholderiales bacterium]